MVFRIFKYDYYKVVINGNKPNACWEQLKQKWLLNIQEQKLIDKGKMIYLEVSILSMAKILYHYSYEETISGEPGITKPWTPATMCAPRAIS